MPETPATTANANDIPEDEVHKGNPQNAKVALEVQILEQQLSKPYAIREWLKALTGLGAIAALFAVFFQLQQSHDQRGEDRLERSIARLASANISDRLSGVSTLQIFLDEGSKTQKRIALSSLAGAAAIENERVVRGAILDALKRADSGSLDYVLEELANGSRGLLPEAMKKEPRQAFELWIVDAGDFGRLKDLSAAMVDILHRGARTHNLSGIYCVQCDLGHLNLSAIDFSGAVLNSSTFQQANLADSSFEHAVLLGTDFTGADLRRTQFTLGTQNRAFALGSIENGGEMAWGPDFTCADLQDADFSRQPLFSFVEDANLFVSPGSYFSGNFSNANIEGAKFLTMGIYGVARPSADFQKYPSTLQLMTHDFPLPLRTFGWSNPKEITLSTPDGAKKNVEFVAFSGTTDPSLGVGSDVEKFATSMKRVASGFAHSNWNKAQLPSSLRQVLSQANVPTTPDRHCPVAAK